MKLFFFSLNKITFFLPRVMGLLILLFCIFNSSVLFAVTPLSQKLSNIRNQEPSLYEIVQKALEREELGMERIKLWEKKMKLAPWFPTLYVGFDHSFKETNALSVSDNISVTTSGVAVGPSDNDFDQTINQGNTIRVRAVWSLDELVFHPSTFQASREGRDLSKSRFFLSDVLFKIYTERHQLIAQYFFMKGKRDMKSILIKEKIDDFTEKLNLLTDNEFYSRWWRE